MHVEGLYSAFVTIFCYRPTSEIYPDRLLTNTPPLACALALERGPRHWQLFRGLPSLGVPPVFARLRSPTMPSVSGMERTAFDLIPLRQSLKRPSFGSG